MGKSASLSRILGAGLAGLAFGAATSVNAAIVLANNPAPGDSYTNAGASNQGQAVGATGWYYNNVRKSGTVGINTSNPRSGNGSAAMSGPFDSKADIEYLPGATNLGGNFYSTASLGSLSALSSMSYDWYRDSSSAAASHLHPALRVLLDADGDLNTPGDRGGLVFERIYNGGAAAPTNAWQSDTVTGTTNVWNFGLGVVFAYDIGGDGYAYDDDLAAWQAFLPNAKIIGFSAGIGSGWDTFEGAVDNIAWTIGTQGTQTSNFEVTRAQVPVPGGMLLLGIGALALGIARRWPALH
ncbi:MAG: hypothetical protein IT530_00895 [Burkholderiales bacterium]|nr:hypothetical protein [Burkholderiales bacterium]